MSDKIINLAYIGSSRSNINALIELLKSKKIHHLWLTGLTQDELNAISNIDKNITVNTDYRAILATGEIEYIIVDNNYEERYEILSEALAFNKKSLSIAPFLYHIDQIDSVFLIADAYQIPVIAGHPYEFYDGIITMAELIMHKELGNVQNINIITKYPVKQNILFEQTIHDLYITNYIMGKNATSLKSEALDIKNNRINGLHSTIYYDDIPYVSIQSGDSNIYLKTIIISCDKGLISYQLHEENGLNEKLVVNGKEIELEKVNPFKVMVRNFIKVVEDKEEMEVNRNSAIQSVRMACIMEESLQNDSINIPINEMTAKVRKKPGDNIININDSK